MMRHLLIAMLLAGLAGCATLPPSEPREVRLAASPETTLRVAMALLMDRGYVIRYADGELGRLDAVLARMPGYGVSLRVVYEGQPRRVREGLAQDEDDNHAPRQRGHSQLSVVATRRGRALPPAVLDPLLTDLQARLADVRD